MMLSRGGVAGTVRGDAEGDDPTSPATSSEDGSSSVGGGRYSSPEESTGDRKLGSSSSAALLQVSRASRAARMACRLGLKTMKNDNMYCHIFIHVEFSHRASFR